MTTMQKIYFLILIINQLFFFKTNYCQSTLVQDSSNLLIDDVMFTSQSFGKPTGTSLSIAPWPNGEVYISLDSLYSTGLRDKFLNAFNEYERETLIDFIERTDQRDYISVTQTTNKSSSYLGMIGGRQTLHIAVHASYGTILHELGHAIGLIHEHERSDRDEYINIFPENALPEKRYLIERKFDDSINLTQYDFHSIMHFWKTVVSFNGLNTIEPKEKYIHLIDSIGQRKRLSNLDKISVNKIYSFSPIAINPEYNQAFEANNTINFKFVSTTSGYQYFLKIYSDSSLQNIIYDSRMNHYSRYISELTIDVWANFKAGDYFWRIESISEDAELKYSETYKFFLVNDLISIVHQYPNPFNNRTIFEYLLNSTSKVTLDVFNTRGQKVTTIISETQPQGFYFMEWNANDIASGLYIYRFRANKKESIGKLNIIN
jgi:hypothetical protein